eukprot:CAMPEP_0175324864 /NCGR_PEP_ID=MMETSP0093-20121207/73714_1 /TAXON_ID=311494 /ORGANISM="Alexandrium monilatum, Strain CCMP3105" /LENGTH=40 /DNA_ID= /DNA_START= /DNA_END= /DNA_ORIENTATION=
MRARGHASLWRQAPTFEGKGKSSSERPTVGAWQLPQAARA